MAIILFMIETPEEYDLLEKLTPYSFKCKDCEKVVTTKKKSTKKDQDSQKAFLCKACKIKRTCLEKYGTTNVSKTQAVKTKIKQTTKERYGVDNIMHLDQFKENSRSQAKTQWASLTGEERLEIKTKISESLKVFNSNLTQEELEERSERSRQTWASFTEEEKEAIKSTQSQKSRKWWSSLTDEQRQSISEKRSLFRKSVWDSLTDEERKAISEKQKQYWLNLSEKEKVEFSTRQKQVWANRTSEERKEIRRKSNKKGKYKSQDGEVFDSLWELKYYEYCKLKGYNIIREPCGLQYEYQGRRHYYYPDFEVEGQLVEVKGNQFLGKGTWVNIYDRNQDSLYEAKRQCALKNNVKILYEEDLIELGIKL